MDIAPQDDIFISINDVRRFGFCGKGSRVWAAKHDLDWKKFVDNGGIMASELLQKGDAMAVKLYEEVKARK